MTLEIALVLIILRLAGHREMTLIAAIMLTAGSLSAFMNNVGVAALLLPVVMDICRRTRIPPSKLLIPLAFSSVEPLLKATEEALKALAK